MTVVAPLLLRLASKNLCVLVDSLQLVCLILLNISSRCVQIQIFRFSALHPLPEFCHCEPRTSSFLVKSIDVFSQNTVQFLFHIISFYSGQRQGCAASLQSFCLGCDLRQWRRGACRSDYNTTSARLSMATPTSVATVCTQLWQKR